MTKTNLLVLGLLPALVFAQPNFEIEFIETDPADGVALNANEPLYVRLKYQSDQPLRFQAMGFLNGAKVDKSASFNPAPEYPAGGGETIAWVAYYEKTNIDEVKIIVSAENWTTLQKLSLPVDISWNGVMSRTRRQPEAWVQTLNAEQQSMTTNLMQQTPSGGSMAFWGLLMMLMAWSIPGYIVLQIYMLRKYEGRWRTLAKLPLWGTIPLFAYTLLALLAGSNLWPLMLLFLGPFAFIYLLIIWWIKRTAE